MIFDFFVFQETLENGGSADVRHAVFTRGGGSGSHGGGRILPSAAKVLGSDARRVLRGAAQKSGQDFAPLLAGFQVVQGAAKL